ncbi:sigma-70 family RNA polymerase sigma factor [Pseudonocardia sp. CA-107938]|uniref:sigma-70 family RNA polymerase sigma factor n=1 Tax=Pseudonocardia sp. CA-107938 TaxID=3240021 RepID=UPI003D8A455B
MSVATEAVAAEAQQGRAPSEFSAERERLCRLAELPPDHPEREPLREQLILTFLPLAERIAARYGTGRAGSRDDLRQVASLAVIKAIDRWDTSRAEGDVLGYFVPCVRGELLRWFRDRSWAVRVPRRLKELTVAIDRMTGELTQQLGRAPRPSELARALNADLDEVLEALKAAAHHDTLPLDAPGPGTEDDNAIADRLGDDDHRLELVEDLEALRPLLAQLPARERRILLLRFYGGRTQTQIAEEVGISQMHVSRLLARTLATLRRQMLAETAR